MEKFFSAIKDYRGEIKTALSMLSPREKIVFSAIFLVFAVSIIGFLFSVNNLFLVEVPVSGGSLVEGVIGLPRFINPVLSSSDVDRDITSLLYSGLVRVDSSGEVVPDLAEKYEISDDGLEYTFTLKEGLTWHDGKPIGADDIDFTIKKIQDPAMKSPKSTAWQGVTVSKIDDKTVKFTLKQPYAPFIENATIGILPKHLWKDISNEQFPFSLLNLSPIGSGPYKIKKIKDSGSGSPEWYDLVPFQEFSLGAPLVSELRINFFPSEEKMVEAFKKGSIGSMAAIPPEIIERLDFKNSHVIKSDLPLPRVLAIFFNQNQNEVFSIFAVRKALLLAVDKEQLISSIFGDYATVANGPIPEGVLGHKESTNSEEAQSQEERYENARKILVKDGWVWDENEEIYQKKIKDTNGKTKTVNLEFSLQTTDSAELKEVAEFVKGEWEKIGAKVNLEIYELGDLSQNVIRPRKYDALLFGEVVGRDPDLSVFWHSSQRNDPGYNVAMYANIKADKLLEQAKVAYDKNERISKLEAFESEVAKDIPAIFLYSPYFTYIMPKEIKAVEIKSIASPSERFSGIYNWYIETDKVWKIFANYEQQ